MSDAEDQIEDTSEAAGRKDTVKAGQASQSQKESKGLWARLRSKKKKPVKNEDSESNSPTIKAGMSQEMDGNEDGKFAAAASGSWLLQS